MLHLNKRALLFKMVDNAVIGILLKWGAPTKDVLTTYIAFKYKRNDEPIDQLIGKYETIAREKGTYKSGDTTKICLALLTIKN